MQAPHNFWHESRSGLMQASQCCMHQSQTWSSLLDACACQGRVNIDKLNSDWWNSPPAPFLSKVLAVAQVSSPTSSNSAATTTKSNSKNKSEELQNSPGSA